MGAQRQLYRLARRHRGADRTGHADYQLPEAQQRGSSSREKKLPTSRTESDR